MRSTACQTRVITIVIADPIVANFAKYGREVFERLHRGSGKEPRHDLSTPPAPHLVLLELQF